MPDPFATVFGQEWFVDTDANLVITDQGVFPLEIFSGVLNGVLFTAPPTFILGTVLLENLLSGVVFLAPPTFPTGSVTLAPTTTFTGWGIPAGIS